MAPTEEFARAFHELVRLKPNGEKITPYGYYPTKWICILYVVLFSLTTIAHFVQTFYTRPRQYWILPTIVMCGMTELLGWSARTWSSINSQSHNAFLMQITTTIIAPTFLTAAFYTILGRLIPGLGIQFSRMRPKVYIIVFVTADVAALVVQAVGGAQASGATDPTNGAHIMLAGIALQLAGIVVYIILGVEFMLRFHLQKPLKPKTLGSGAAQAESSSSDIEKPDNVIEGRGVMTRRQFMMVSALVVATVMVVIRSVYRSIELAGGWNGVIITTEKYFDILDGAPIVIAMYTLNFFHPSILLQE